ncbi:MAG: hypothetical protein FJZ56_03750 [Chlamydiae bacterium]|nr:hypothetical protein [Chlamydiota bacterium]
MKKALSIFLIIFGAGIFFYGSYIGKQVQNQEQMMQQSGGARRRVPLVGPVRKGTAIASNQQAQKRQGAMQMWLMNQENSVGWLHGIGAVMFIAGTSSLIVLSIPRKNRD